MTEASNEPFNPLSPAFKSNPFPTYAELRQRPAAIQRVSLGQDLGAWLVTRYQDVVTVLRDPRFIKSPRRALSPQQLETLDGLPEAVRVLNSHMLATDPPDHGRLRRLVQHGFTPRYVESLRPKIQAIADRLLDAALPLGQVDLIGSYALPLPLTVIAEMLGVPEEDFDQFSQWSSTLITNAGTFNSVEGLLRVAPTLQSFEAYFKDLFAQKRRSPGLDLTSQLVRAEETGDALSEAELVSMMFLLLVAGHETTVNLIGNGVLTLLQHPEQLALLLDQPELLEQAVEELLRFDGPVETSTPRYAAEDFEFGGVQLSRGDMVFVVISSANRDELQIERPNVLDLRRAENRHIAFGYGLHYCLGAPLARLEGQIAIGTLLRRAPGLRLQVGNGALTWKLGALMRGLERLPVTF